MNMHSTTLISTNYAFNFGLQLYQALLNCEIPKFIKKLVADTSHVAIWCSSYKTDSISLPLSSTHTKTNKKKLVRKREPPDESGWVWAGAVWR